MTPVTSEEMAARVAQLEQELRERPTASQMRLAVRALMRAMDLPEAAVAEAPLGCAIKHANEVARLRAEVRRSSIWQDLVRGKIKAAERKRLVRIANGHGAATAMAAIGFVRCKEVHSESGERCLLGDGHRSPAGDYAYHRAQTVTWRALPVTEPLALNNALEGNETGNDPCECASCLGDGLQCLLAAPGQGTNAVLEGRIDTLHKWLAKAEVALAEHAAERGAEVGNLRGVLADVLASLREAVAAWDDPDAPINCIRSGDPIAKWRAAIAEAEGR